MQSEVARDDLAFFIFRQATGEDRWPTNEELGGGLTGTRDDEFRALYEDEADALLAAFTIVPKADVSWSDHG